MTVPPGWTLDSATAPYSLISQSIALAAYQGTPPSEVSRVIQFSGLAATIPTVVFTDVPGKVFLLEYSTDGSRLLAHQVLPNSPFNQIRVTMLNSAGQVVWTRDGDQIFRFSTTGEALVAFHSGEFQGLGNEAEVFTPAGQLVRRVKYAEFVESVPNAPGPTVRGFILVGNGERAIISTDAITTCVTLAGTPVVQWRIASTASYQAETRETQVLDSQRIAMLLTRGRFKIVRVSSGAVDYELDPIALDASDPNPTHDRWFWASYRPFAGATSTTVSLFNRTAEAYTLDLGSGALTPRAIDASTPSGFTLRERIDAQSLVLTGATQARVRQLVP